MPAAVSGSRVPAPSHSCGRPGLGVPGPGADIPVQAPGGLVADPDDPVLAALAADGDLPLPQIDVTAPRVTGVVPQAGQLGQPDAGGPEHRDDRGIAALGLAEYPSETAQVTGHRAADLAERGEAVPGSSFARCPLGFA